MPRQCHVNATSKPFQLMSMPCQWQSNSFKNCEKVSFFLQKITKKIKKISKCQILSIFLTLHGNLPFFWEDLPKNDEKTRKKEKKKEKNCQNCVKLKKKMQKKIKKQVNRRWYFIWLRFQNSICIFFSFTPLFWKVEIFFGKSYSMISIQIANRGEDSDQNLFSLAILSFWYLLQSMWNL